MKFAFDLISDLHLDYTGTAESFDWTGQATSRFCLVAGDIARDRELLVKTLTHLGECYEAVFYIDGNEEHKNYMTDLGASYRDLAKRIKTIHRVHYLQDQVIVIQGVALLASNGWWGFDFDETANPEIISSTWLSETSFDEVNPYIITALSHNDAAYIQRSVKRLQLHNDVKKIVIVTHTVPDTRLVDHDLQLINSWRYGVIGNSNMNYALDLDTEKKIHTWCFGHYHGAVDRVLENRRFVNNCRGRSNHKNFTPAYFPRRIEVEI